MLCSVTFHTCLQEDELLIYVDAIGRQHGIIHLQATFMPFVHLRPDAFNHTAYAGLGVVLPVNLV